MKKNIYEVIAVVWLMAGLFPFIIDAQQPKAPPQPKTLSQRADVTKKTVAQLVDDARKKEATHRQAATEYTGDAFESDCLAIARAYVQESKAFLAYAQELGENEEDGTLKADMEKVKKLYQDASVLYNGLQAKCFESQAAADVLNDVKQLCTDVIDWCVPKAPRAPAKDPTGYFKSGMELLHRDYLHTYGLNKLLEKKDNKDYRDTLETIARNYADNKRIQPLFDGPAGSPLQKKDVAATK